MDSTKRTRLDLNWRELTYIRLSLHHYRQYVYERVTQRDSGDDLDPDDHYDLIMLDWLLQKTDPESGDAR